MSERLTVGDYLRTEETSRPRELAYGILRDPPAPTYGHQSVVTRLTALLDACVAELRLGRVCVSPIDVILDADRALIVQPDIVFISTARLGLVRDQIWGAPDLIVEVLSRSTGLRDRTVKMDWYRRYGVREGWIVDPLAAQVEIVDFTARPGTALVCRRDGVIASAVLPDFRVPVALVFE
jgi:Uma2 family endonuclease